MLLHNCTLTIHYKVQVTDSHVQQSRRLIAFTVILRLVHGPNRTSLSSENNNIVYAIYTYIRCRCGICVCDKIDDTRTTDLDRHHTTARV